VALALLWPLDFAFSQRERESLFTSPYLISRGGSELALTAAAARPRRHADRGHARALEFLLLALMFGSRQKFECNASGKCRCRNRQGAPSASPSCCRAAAMPEEEGNNEMAREVIPPRLPLPRV